MSIYSPFNKNPKLKKIDQFFFLNIVFNARIFFREKKYQENSIIFKFSYLSYIWNLLMLYAEYLWIFFLKRRLYTMSSTIKSRCSRISTVSLLNINLALMWKVCVLRYLKVKKYFWIVIFSWKYLNFAALQLQASGFCSLFIIINSVLLMNNTVKSATIALLTKIL